MTDTHGVIDKQVCLQMVEDRIKVAASTLDLRDALDPGEVSLRAHLTTVATEDLSYVTTLLMYRMRSTFADWEHGNFLDRLESLRDRSNATNERT